jgi:hypothetical protein
MNFEDKDEKNVIMEVVFKYFGVLEQKKIWDNIACVGLVPINLICKKWVESKQKVNRLDN